MHLALRFLKCQRELLAERLFSEEIDNICAIVIAEAKKGNMQAAKIILDRILPPRKDHPISIDLPQVQNSADLAKATSCLVNTVSCGQITPSEGEALARILDIHTETLELCDLERRISILEGIGL